MKNLNHSKGPWKVVFDNPCASPAGHTIKQDDEVECPVANLWVGGGTKGKPKQRANARLISCAPEMLEALIDMVSRPFSTKMSLAEWKKLYEKEIAIIEKATNQKIEDLL